ncbi:hypothetical protein B23_3139 [Geobacillus thermoleovorans B23]|uniref:PEP/pyruvate-binding domain-containing protein n=2 Tax=Anoxybacillaceae TaxID=3120669 RepID=UPI000425CDF6|nr:PEP/pyruvate-binding domain-containing protein [Geobacillus sp. A8]GAJ59913.1 hypothetical protein B23_3139 [Geobacillus thermoleovorans B23]
MLQEISSEKISLDSSLETVERIASLQYTALGEIYGINLVQIEHGLKWAMEQLLLEEIPKEDVRKYIPYLLGSEKATIGVIAEKTALALSIKVSEKKLTLREAEKEYLSKYKNLNYAYGAVKKNNVAAEKLKYLIETPLKERIQLFNKLDNLTDCNKSNSLVDKIIRSHEIRDKLIKLNDIAIKVGDLRDKNKALMGQVAYQRNRLLNNLASLTGEKRENLSRYMLFELFELAENQKRLSEETINLRYDYVVLNRIENCLIGDKAREATLVVDFKTDKNDQIKGTTASMGNVKGYVKHVRDISDLNYITKEDILVAKGTDFNFMDAMMKSKGFITEEGGILSHAAVIARELKKPCLIGIPNVFSKIPEGSFINLNADQGYVKVIHRKVNEKKIPFVKLDDASNSVIVGNKAYRLYELLKHNINVLPGIVIPSSININDYTANDVEILLNEIKMLFPECSHLVVRSSSPSEDLIDKSVAGILESKICKMESFDLYNAIQYVQESGKKGIIKYYFSKDEVDLAVLIQPYLKQDLGGVIFTCNPIGDDENDMLIEASYGGASNVVNGKVDIRETLSKSSYKSNYKIFNNLAEIANYIENLYGYPVDIEWGAQNQKIYIFQVRPITTLSNKVGEYHD